MRVRCGRHDGCGGMHSVDERTLDKPDSAPTTRAGGEPKERAACSVAARQACADARVACPDPDRQKEENVGSSCFRGCTHPGRRDGGLHEAEPTRRERDNVCALGRSGPVATLRERVLNVCLVLDG